MSVKKEFVLIIDIPKKIYEAQKKGYTHFEADFEGDTRRVVLRSWRRKDRASWKLECETCQKPMPSSSALKTHQAQLGHGPYSLMKPEGEIVR